MGWQGLCTPVLLIPSKNEACMNWSDYKNVHCMRLHHAHATFAGMQAMHQARPARQTMCLEPKTVKESHSVLDNRTSS